MHPTSPSDGINSDIIFLYCDRDKRGNLNDVYGIKKTKTLIERGKAIGLKLKNRIHGGYKSRDREYW